MEVIQEELRFFFLWLFCIVLSFRILFNGAELVIGSFSDLVMLVGMR